MLGGVDNFFGKYIFDLVCLNLAIKLTIVILWYMDIVTVVNSLFFANTYIIVSGDKAIVIDPGSSIGEYLKIIESRGLRPLAILATHGHIDHIIGAYELHRRYDAPFYIHREDEYLLSRGEVEKIRLFLGDINVDIKEPDEYLVEGPLSIQDFSLGIIHTPGHTMGSVCIWVGGSVFTGDTIFRESVGRTDFGGDLSRLIESVHNKLFSALDGGTVLYPGHGPSTTIGHEIRNNPFVGRRGMYPYRSGK